MYYIVKVQPWITMPPSDAENESIVSLETELGRQFIVEAKTQSGAIARVVRDVVNIRKATPKELLEAGKSGELILSQDDPLPAPPAVESPPQQAPLIPAGDPPPNASTVTVGTVTAAPPLTNGASGTVAGGTTPRDPPPVRNHDDDNIPF